MRKSPIKHKVRTHKKKEKIVQNYVRGDGNSPKLAKPTIAKLNKPKGYTVNFKFSDKPGDVETVKVISTTYLKALDEAFEEKLDERLPTEIQIIDPSIGEILKWAGSRALKYGKTATKKIAKGAYDSAKKMAMSKVSDWKTKKLIEDAYSEDKGTSTLARAKLKRDYPHVWDIIGLSKKSYGTPRKRYRSLENYRYQN